MNVFEAISESWPLYKSLMNPKSTTTHVQSSFKAWYLAYSLKANSLRSLQIVQGLNRQAPRCRLANQWWMT